MMVSLVNKVVIAEFRKNDPDRLNEIKAMCRPMVTDVKLIPAIVRAIEKNLKKNPENMPTFIGVVYYLLCKWKLYFPALRIPNGIREELCSEMEWVNKPVVNYYSNITTAYYKGARYAEKIKILSEEVYHELKAEGLLNGTDNN